MRRVAVKLAYDGRGFHGLQRQPGLRTVESELIGALRAIGAIGEPSDHLFMGAARTDKGVSALGNVFAFDTDFPVETLLPAVDALMDGVYAYSLVEVPERFDPRAARMRRYRYVAPRGDLDIEAFSACGRSFEGTHDFAAFSRSDGRPTTRTVDSVEVTAGGNSLVIDVAGRSFLWNMVRRMVGAMTSVGDGSLAVERVDRALSTGEGGFDTAPAEGLTLMDVEYPFDFPVSCPLTLMRRLETEARDAALRHGLHLSMLERVGMGPVL